MIGIRTGAKVGARAGQAVGAGADPLSTGGAIRSWTITKSGGAPGTYDAGAFSNQSIAGQGYVEITVDALNKDRTIGFSTVDVGVNFNTIERGIILTGSSLYSTVNGTFVIIGSYAVNDVIRVVRGAANAMTIVQNGATVATIASLAGSLFVDASLADTVACRLAGIKLFDGVTQKALTWTGSVNVTLTED